MDPCTNFSMLLGTTLLAVLGAVTTHIHLGIPSSRSSQFAASAMPSPSPSSWIPLQHYNSRAALPPSYDPIVTTATVSCAYDGLKPQPDITFLSQCIFEYVAQLLAPAHRDSEVIVTYLFIATLLALKPDVRYQFYKLLFLAYYAARASVIAAASLVPADLRTLALFVWREVLLEIGYLSHMDYTPPARPEERADTHDNIIRAADDDSHVTQNTTGPDIDPSATIPAGSQVNEAGPSTSDGPRLRRLDLSTMPGTSRYRPSLPAVPVEPNVVGHGNAVNRNISALHAVPTYLRENERGLLHSQGSATLNVDHLIEKLELRLIQHSVVRCRPQFFARPRPRYDLLPALKYFEALASQSVPAAVDTVLLGGCSTPIPSLREEFNALSRAFAQTKGPGGARKTYLWRQHLALRAQQKYLQEQASEAATTI
ncbi:hypothetical protein EXIGLDRAFT_755534, partial [Exidia glandulosa HHB12029]